MVLLAAYEDFTRRESVSLRDGNIELMGRLQDKKAKVIAQLESLQDEVAQSEMEDFSSRVAALLKQEKENDRVLTEKLAMNRQEFRRLSKNSVSASKFRNAYASPIDRSAPNGSLKGRA